MALEKLIDTWQRYVRRSAGYEEAAAYIAVVDDIRDYSQTAWHPAADPPTESDGNWRGQVLYAWCHCGEWHLWLAHWSGIDNERPADCWARIRDVVLIPEVSDGLE